MDAFDHQELPFERLVEALSGQRDVRHTPLFQVMFTHYETDTDPADDETEVWSSADEMAKFELSVSVFGGPSSMTLNLEYMTHLFLPATIERFARNYRVLLEAVVSDPDTLLGRLPILTESERGELLAAASGQTDPYEADVTILTYLRQMVREHGDRPAYVWADGQLTFSDLYTRASHLARLLAERGAGPETPVAICVQRSEHQLIAVWGALLSGAPYVPLDPDYPAERTAFILADTEARGGAGDGFNGSGAGAYLGTGYRRKQ